MEGGETHTLRPSPVLGTTGSSALLFPHGAVWVSQALSGWETGEEKTKLELRSIGASASVLPMNIQDSFPLALTDSISVQSKGFSRVFSNTTVQKLI